MKNKKPLLLLLALLILIGIFLSIRFLNTEEKAITGLPFEENANDVTEEFFEEEEIEKPHNLKLALISPEGENFEEGQARFYKAFLEGNGKYESARLKCHWKFYLNQNNEEALYEEMENTGILGLEDKEVCGFTSTFIEDRGVLRVVLTLTLQNMLGEDLETIEAERTYIVE